MKLKPYILLFLLYYRTCNLFSFGSFFFALSLSDLMKHSIEFFHIRLN